MFVPDFTRRDVQVATTPEALARGQGMAVLVEDLDWDGYSLCGRLPGEGIGVGELLVHHAGRPLTGECPCPDGRAAELCTHMVALASAFLGDDTELADRLAAPVARRGGACSGVGRPFGMGTDVLYCPLLQSRVRMFSTVQGFALVRPAFAGPLG